MLAKELIHHATLCFVLVLTFKQPCSGLCNIICGLKYRGRTYLSPTYHNSVPNSQYTVCWKLSESWFTTSHMLLNWVGRLVPITSRFSSTPHHATFYIESVFTVLNWIEIKALLGGYYGRMDIRKNNMFERDWTTCSKYDNRFKFSSEHNWGEGRIYDHLKGCTRRIFTLIMDEMFLWTP